MTTEGSAEMNPSTAAIDNFITTAYQRLDRLMQGHAAAGSDDQQAITDRACEIFADIEAALTLADLLGLLE
ncbi:hypothetical protein QMO56_26725 [Roseomonas sp. E05]|uniref:hypothetical protein n=1 Tax=Roseomonas sp. E05 TaxID=3046310 RepID=UPI0024B8C537|nr:hypothetical protein [Roseomonas sp. E05]MDJ0391688.1 hypothetical protein [Roseomonas sp. E05]